MSTDLQVVITGKDGVSRIFQEVAKSAKTAGDAIEAAGKEGAQGLKQIDDAARKADTSVESVGKTAGRASIDFDRVGAAAIALGLGIDRAGQAAATHEQTIIGLQSAWGDAADEYIAFADTIAANSIFNDDDILKGQRYFAALRSQYELTDQQIQDLMVTTADLASAAGINFEDASSRVTAAIRGEAEAAEYLGLSLNQQSIDRENLTLSMTNQEAAQFRLAALNEQAASFSGNAVRLAESEVGARARLTNAFQDNVQAIGAFIGPQQALIAGAASGAIGLAQFAGGFGALASGIRVATTASLAFVATPLGLAVTAVGGVLALATFAFLDHRKEVAETAQAWADAEAAAGSLMDQIREISLFDWDIGRWASDVKSDFDAEFAWTETWLEDTLMKSFGTGDWFDKKVMETLGPAANVQSGELEGRWQLVAEDLITSMMPTPEHKERFYTAMGDILSLEGVIGDTHFDAIQGEVDRLFQAFDKADGAISVEQFVAQLEHLHEANLRAAQGIDITTLAVNNLAAAQQTWQDLGAGSIGATTEEMAGYEQAAASATVTTEGLVATMRALNEAREGKSEDELFREGYLEAERLAAERLALSHRLARVAAGDLAATMADTSAHVKELAVAQELSRAAAGEQAAGYIEVSFAALAMGKAIKEVATASLEEMQDLVTSLLGLDDPLTAWNAAGLGTDLTETAESAQRAATALEGVFRVIVGNTNALGSLSQGVADWAEELINVEGTYGKIDDLRSKGLITETQYTQAQTAYNDIARENAEIQDHVLQIQAMQAPLIRDSIAALENQLELISGYSAEQQLVTLGWMDSASAAKAMEIQTLAAAVAAGQLGANGEAAFQSYIDGITATDPVMTQMLLDMELIDEHIAADGTKTYTINLDGAEAAQSEIELLTDSIDRLFILLGGDPALLEVNAEDNATPIVETLIEVLQDADGQEANVNLEAEDNATSDINAVLALLGLTDGDLATVYVNAVDNASGIIGTVSTMIRNLDNDTATTYINTITTHTIRQVFENRGIGPTQQMHGGIAEYALGGNVIPIWAGEGNRPEIEHYAGGGSALIPREGLWMARQGSYIEPSNSVSARGGVGSSPIIVHVHVAGNLTTERQIIASAAEAIWRAEIEDKRRRDAALGLAS